MRKNTHKFVVLGLGLLVSLSWAQQLSGTVLGPTRQPIPQALVAHSTNPLTFSKTDAQGRFTLPGASGTLLDISALGYAGVRGYVVREGEPLAVEMRRDPFLESDVFHIDFEHLRPGPSYSKADLLGDLPVSYGGGFFDPGKADSDRAAVDISQSVSGNGRSLKVTFPAGQLNLDPTVDRIVFDATLPVWHPSGSPFGESSRTIPGAWCGIISCGT